MNYQLARTNTYIGGQLKLDLTINKIENELYIEDFHMSPVSNYTGYAWGTDKDLLNNRHSENIKDYYTKTKNIFFEDCLNPALNTKYPIYSPNYLIDTHSIDDKMGLYRLPFKTYGKAYGFFCPFWLTDPEIFNKMRFKFNLYTYNDIVPGNDEASEEDPNPHYVCSAILYMRDIAGKEFHNKFVKYFDEYLKGFASHEYDIKESKFLTTNVLSQGYELDFGQQNIVRQKSTDIEEAIEKPFLSDDLLYISLSDSQGWVKGIDPNTGSYMIKDVSYICETLMDRERPLMDNDYYLARIFKDNSIIAQQLINFNFIFDLADIVPYNIYEEMQYRRINITVDIEYDGVEGFEKLSLKDFYSNYDYIPKAVIEDTTNGPVISFSDNRTEENNVLAYKDNDKYIEYAYKNKMIQNVVHWSIGDSNYIFNLYNGFSPRVGSDGRSSEGNMPFSPNISIAEYDAAAQNVMWAKLKLGSIENEQIELLTNPEKYFTNFHYGKQWIEGVQYEYGDKDSEDFADIWVMLIPTNNYEDNIQFDSELDRKQKIKIYAKKENLTFQKVFQKLDSHPELFNSVDDTPNYCEDLYNYMRCAVFQKAIILRKNYISRRSESPSDLSNEVDLIVPNTSFMVDMPLYRYDGKLQPMLIDVDENDYINDSYYVKQFEEDLRNLSAYADKNNMRFQPTFPSIGYSSIKSEEVDYENTPNITYYEEDTDKYLGERRWYNGSYMFTVPQKISLTKISEELSTNAIYEGFVNEILNRFGLTIDNDNAWFVMNYILPLYTYGFTYEKQYEDGTNVPIVINNKFRYVYTINFELI